MVQKGKVKVPSFIVLFVVLVYLLYPHLTMGEERENPKPDEINEFKLTLSECINLALKNNLEIKVEEITPMISEAEIIQERSKFDPVALLSASQNKSLIEQTSLLQGVFRGSKMFMQKGIDVDFSLAERLITGGKCELSYSYNRYETNSFFQLINPTYRSDLTFSITQPILRNFGIDLNRSKIKIASNNRLLSLDQFKDRASKVVCRAEETYWGLILSGRLLEVKKKSLKLAENLLERNKSLVEVGKLPPVEILQAQVGVASREEEVIITESKVRDVEDLLKELLSLPLKGQTIVPLDRPTFEPIEADLEKSLENAFRLRPDYHEVKVNMDNLEILTKVAKNQMLPGLDLKASYGLNGINKEYRDTWGKLDDADTYSWIVGLSLEVPLGNRWAKNEFLKRKLDTNKASLILEGLKKRIEVEVREAAREVNTCLKRIEATKQARLLAETRLKAEEERLELGLTTSVEVLRFQEGLAVSEAKEITAIIDYLRAWVNLSKVTGTALHKNKIEIEGS
jgi:outer membrane protein TolC